MRGRRKTDFLCLELKCEWENLLLFNYANTLVNSKQFFFSADILWMIGIIFSEFFNQFSCQSLWAHVNNRQSVQSHNLCRIQLNLSKPSLSIVTTSSTSAQFSSITLIKNILNTTIITMLGHNKLNNNHWITA